MKSFITICLFLFSLFAEEATLISVNKIWDKDEYSAFPDIIEYQNKFWVAFREANDHIGVHDGKVRILSSTDGNTWNEETILAKEGYDLRDPKFSLMPNGKLMLNMGGSRYDNGDVLFHSFIAFSSDGKNWSPLQQTNLKGEWVWRVEWLEDTGYGFSYRVSDPSDLKKPWVLSLFKTQDGTNYTLVKEFDISKHPSEATVRFLKDKTMVALLRRQGNGWIGQAKPPYTDFDWKDVGFPLGGPNFIVLPDGKMWAASRSYTLEGGKLILHTAVGPMTLTTYKPEFELPSLGDTSYPGLAYKDGILYVVYYSSHEQKTSIYLAKIKLAEKGSQDSVKQSP